MQKRTTELQKRTTGLSMVIWNKIVHFYVFIVQIHIDGMFF